MRVRVRQGFDYWKDPVWTVEYKKWYTLGWSRFIDFRNKCDAVEYAKLLKNPEIYEVRNESKRGR